MHNLLLLQIEHSLQNLANKFLKLQEVCKVNTTFEKLLYVAFLKCISLCRNVFYICQPVLDAKGRSPSCFHDWDIWQCFCERSMVGFWVLSMKKKDCYFRFWYNGRTYLYHFEMMITQFLTQWELLYRYHLTSWQILSFINLTEGPLAQQCNLFKSYYLSSIIFLHSSIILLEVLLERCLNQPEFPLLGWLGLCLALLKETFLFP